MVVRLYLVSRAAREHDLGIKRVGEASDRRAQSVGRTGDQCELDTCGASSRDLRRVVVGKVGSDLLVSGGKGQPRLDAEQIASRGSNTRRRALGMDNPGPGGHPVDFARSDGLYLAETISMDDLT